MGISKSLGSDVPNLMMDVPNFLKDVPRVRKYVLRWGLAPNQFFMGLYMKLWTIHVEMEVSKAVGSDVPNLMKDVPNFVNDVPSVPKCDPKWGSTPNHFVMGF